MLNIPPRRGRLPARPTWAIPQAQFYDLDFANGRYWSINGNAYDAIASISRASIGTDLFATAAAGASFNSFASGAWRITPGLGLLCEDAATNSFINSGAPVTQTITLSATGSYTLWVNGSGSAAISAGTATATGYGTASQGVPVTISVTVAGTVVVTITGSLNQVQLENNGYATSYVPTAGAAVTRAFDNITNLTGKALGNGLGANEGFAYFAFNIPVLSTTAMRLFDAASGHQQASLSSTSLNYTRDTGTTTAATSNAYTAGSDGKAAISWGPAGPTAALNGGTPATASFTTPTSFGTVNVGNRSGGGRGLAGFIERMAA